MEEPAPHDASGESIRPLDVDGVEAYLATRPDLGSRLGPDSPLAVREVGDGNLNLVFVVRGDSARPGIVLKQALPYVRLVGESWPLTVERAAAEAMAYETYTVFAGELVPAWYGYDPASHVLALEDLSDLSVWRTALNAGEAHAEAAEAMGRFIGRVAFWTSDLGLDSRTRKARAAAATNADLCRITEDLVFTEPYIDHPNNHFPDGIRPRVEGLRGDAALLTEIADLKHRFMTHGEALIHGDLHTGSVMVGGGRAVAFDFEFCFYGPVAFDLGALWANFLIAAARADRLDRPAPFMAEVDGLLGRSWEAFTGEFDRLWPSRVDPAFGDGFRKRYLASVWVDALGFAAAKAIRRMIGLAHVSDIDSLPEPERSSAADAVLRAARRLATSRRTLPDPASAWQVVSHEIRA